MSESGEERGDRVEQVETHRFERTLPHPPERVWRALTEACELKAWLPDAPPRDRAANDTEVIAFDPPRLLSYRDGEEEVRFELTETEGGCVLVLTSVVRVVVPGADGPPRALALAA